MRYNVEKIKEIVRKNSTTEIIYFWGHTPNQKKMTKSCFSQWYDVYFEVDGEQYHTTEQYMMACKARLFGDEDTRSEIMNSYSPAEYKNHTDIKSIDIRIHWINKLAIKLNHFFRCFCLFLSYNNICDRVASLNFCSTFV